MNATPVPWIDHAALPGKVWFAPSAHGEGPQLYFLIMLGPAYFIGIPWYEDTWAARDQRLQLERGTQLCH